MINDEEYARRFKARILARLSGPDTIWTQENAEEAATDEWESFDRGDDNDPEGSADDCLSYWENDE